MSITDWREIAEHIRPPYERQFGDALLDEERREWQRQLKEHLREKHMIRKQI